MDKYNLKVTSSERAAFRYLTIKAGEWMSQRSIAKEIGITASSVGRAIKLLKKQNLCLSKTQGPSNLVTLNTNNPAAVARKRVENLTLLYESNLVEELSKKHAGCTIILFGSYSRGEDVTKSDIDIAIIGSKMDETDTTRFEKFLERKIVVQSYSNEKAIDRFVLSNLRNGIVLSGGWQ